MPEETNINPQMVYGSIDNDNNFVPLNEQEMVAQSLEALDEFQQTRQYGILNPADTIKPLPKNQITEP